MSAKGIAGTVSVMLIYTLLTAGCQTTYYAVWEKMGKEKRHLLRDQVEKSQDDQQKASKEFKDALTRLKEMYGMHGGDLEKMYDRLSGDYEDCKERAETIDERIAKIQRIAGDLFTEWREEIDQIQNASFKTQSRRKLKDTQTRFAELETALLSARKRMTPVLTNLHDYVLYLKHNLNARAIGTLRGEAAGIETDVDRLIRDIQKSIDAADVFLKTFEK